MTTAVSLFAGVGGFDLALERAGVKVVASVEWDKNAQNVLRKQFPNAQVFGDIQGVTGEQLRAAGFNPIDGIITGGFPCQDLSVAGKRAGLAGSRSGLFWEICRLLDETRTQTFILENVPGLLSSNNGRDMAVVIEALVERGYRIAWRVLDAQYFGVPQRRRRVFIVGCLGNQGRSPEEILAISEGRAGYLAKSNAPRKGSATTIARGAEDSSRAGNFELYDFPEGSVAPTMSAGFLLAENRSFTLATSNFQIIFYGQRVGDVRVQDDKINTLQARMGTGGNNMPMVAEVFPIQGTVIGRSDEAGPQGKGFANDGEPMFTLDRVSGHGVAMAFDTFNQTVSDKNQTIKSHSANNENIGTVLEKSTVRRLTPTECERLQGFPDGWTDGQADSHRYKQMGNAVAVPVVQWIINRLTN